MIIKKGPWDQHLQKGGGESRKGQREKLSCGPGPAPG